MELELVLSDRQSAFRRAVIGAAGAVTLLAPAWELRPWTLPLVPWGLLLGLVVLAAGILGAYLLAAALLAESTELRLTPGRARLRRNGLFRNEDHFLSRHDILAVSLRSHEWDSGPARWYVELVLRHGLPIRSAAQASLPEAQRLKQAVEAALTRI